MLDPTSYTVDREGNEPPEKENNASASASPGAFKPTWKDNFFGYFVGANFDEDYTKKDVRDINLYSSLTFVSVGMATTGTVLALNASLGVSPFASILPIAALYTFLDRNLVRAESIAKADWEYQKNLEKYRDPADIKTGSEVALKITKRLIPFSVRMGVAVCSTIVTGGVILEKMGHTEVEATAHQAYVHHNKSLVAAEAKKEADYDKRIAQLSKAIDRARKGQMTIIPITSTSVTRLPADQERYDRARQAYDALTPQIQAEQQELNKYTSAMIEEGSGAALPQRTGVYGQGPQYTIAKAKADEVRLVLDQLKVQQNAQQKILDDVAARDQSMVAADQARAEKESGQLASHRQSALSTWTNEYQRMQNGRTAAFVRFKKEMTDNPRYKQESQERGLFSDMYLFNKFLDRPGIGVSTALYADFVKGLIFTLEMAAMLGAAVRVITPSEKRDARKRAAISNQIDREALEDHLSNIALHKKVRAKIAEPYRPEANFTGAQESKTL